MANIHHAFSYIELGGGDLATTRAFYEQAFGWEFNEYGPDYLGIKAPDGDGEVGGINAGTQPSPDGVLALLYSRDLDATLVAVEAAGGVVLEGPFDYPGGRRFHFTDPSGNRLGVFHSTED